MYLSSFFYDISVYLTIVVELSTKLSRKSGGILNRMNPIVWKLVGFFIQDNNLKFCEFILKKIVLTYIISGSQETWDEKPSYNRSREDYSGEKEWDDTTGHPNSYRDYTYDEDVEGRGDSDTESTKNQYQRHTPPKKYTDNDISVSQPKVENRVNLNFNSSIVISPKKSANPLKKVQTKDKNEYERVKFNSLKL